MIDQKIFFVFLISCLITFTAILLLRPLANKLKIVDIPSKRKNHQGNIPLIGGISIFIGVFVPIIDVFIGKDIFIVFIVTAFLILLLGFIDDCNPLSPNVKIIIQILIIFPMILFTDLKFETFGHSFGLENQIDLGILSYPVTTLGIIFVINAFNLMDGSDGIIGCLVFLALIGINIFELISLNYNFNILSVALAGSLLPYLWFNLTKSTNRKIFLGDSGSLFLGYCVAFLLLYETQVEKNISPPFALWIISIPIFDVICVMVFRLKNSQQLFVPDRNHLHHFLQKLGFTSIKVLILILGFSGSLLLLALIIEIHLRTLSFPIFLSFLFVYIWLRILFSNLKINM